MVRGIDVSHWNRVDKVDEYIRDNKIDFCICKATEGATYVDRSFNAHVNNCIQRGILPGAYHFARPWANSVDDEVMNFLSVLDTAGIGNMLLALDWEGRALNYGPDWALEWLDTVYKYTGIRPLFYCQQSAVKGYEKIAKANYGLWVARYNNTLGSVSPWSFYTIWQHTSDPLDCNIFNGDMQALYKYATPEKENTPVHTCEFKEALYTWLANWEIEHGQIS